MINARKQRVLAIAALCFMIILFVSVTNTGEKKPQLLAGERSYSPTPGNNKLAQAGGNVNQLVKDKSGVIDESKVKQAEEFSNIKPPVKAPSGDSSQKKITADTSKKAGSAKENLAIKDQKGTSDTKEQKAADSKDPLGNSVAKDEAKADIQRSNIDSKKLVDSDIKKVADTEENAEFDAAKEFKEILSLSPVAIFSKSYCPYSKKLKDLLQTGYDITPQPTVVELDLHKHGKELQDYIASVSGRRTVPNLFVNGVSRGGSDEMSALHADNRLLDELAAWGGSKIKVEKINRPSNS
ncbi:hypothetical protein KL921_004834 [Ogataea angusta]|uniref:Glutaredoxin domain-containing protein n=1 Tax=Pichia angusta TaxID=870730 RepID=A0AAN6DBX4_PICAN|nr:uncharacterized protein KL928_005226 [Ogataea angusta]KAG7806437.1 hypothetical protein KL921_004834 [Ogataea angusta]KAG7815887.1 hypothetical protein KL928_005226 [Ogataea angusta]KAG7827016.1 hypothetical protein KL920_005014 [Ogataea angusta]KAG7854764.1 hypothetical protein KL919_005046 [Ogataea angusta]